MSRREKAGELHDLSILQYLDNLKVMHCIYRQPSYKDLYNQFLRDNSTLAARSIVQLPLPGLRSMRRWRMLVGFFIHRQGTTRKPINFILTFRPSRPRWNFLSALYYRRYFLGIFCQGIDVVGCLSGVAVAIALLIHSNLRQFCFYAFTSSLSSKTSICRRESA